MVPTLVATIAGLTVERLFVETEEKVETRPRTLT
jgi:hypothetical protein